MQTPTIGRKVWVWSNSDAWQSVHQAFDATVIYVHSENRIRVRFDNHGGTQQVEASVLLRDPKEGDCHGMMEEVIVATWMPYQKQQHEKQSS